MLTCHSVVLYIHCLSSSVLTLAVECDQMFINHTNKCTFHTYKCFLILLLHVLASFMPSLGSSKPKFITD
jgi:hypothetical protein